MNIMKMMKDAAAMQKNLEKTQAELAQKRIEFSSGGGMVVVTARGDITIEKIKIDPKVVDPTDVGMLEDLVLAAVEGALREVRDLTAREMGKVTAGLQLPGGKLPFF